MAQNDKREKTCNDKRRRARNDKRTGNNVHHQERTLAPVNISTVTDEMHREQMLFLVRRVNDPMTPYSEPTESLEFTSECLKRKVVEILR